MSNLSRKGGKYESIIDINESDERRGEKRGEEQQEDKEEEGK